MYFYEVAILSSPLSSLFYCSVLDIKIGTIVEIVIRNRNSKAVVLLTCQKPEFETSEILKATDFIYSKKQMELAKFISSYYVCSLGEALGDP